MAELQDDAGSVLQLLKDGDDPTARDQERVRHAVWARLSLAGAAATVAATGVHMVASQGAQAAAAGVGASVAPAALGANAGAMGAGSIAASAVGAKAGWFVTVVKVGLATALVGAGGWYGARALDADPEPAAREAAQSVAPAVVPAGGVTSTEATEVVSAPVEKPTEPPSQDTSRARAATAGDELNSEVALLTEAQRSLAAGNYAAALASLDKHAARYPRGALASEREASRAIALCKSGSLSKGQAVGKRYLAKNANSPLRARVRTACKLDE